MEVEVRSLVAALEQPAEEHIEGWTFWRGTLDGYPVVISKTFKGMSSAAAATALAAERFHPTAIINQGTAGGHDPALHVYDIVIGREAVNVGAFKTAFRPRGGGSNFAEWRPMDLLYSEGSAGQDPNAWTMHRFHADPSLLRAASQASSTYAKGRVVEGVIGSSDTWTSELDRIERLHEEFRTSVEEMETASAAQVAGLAHVPFLGIRIVSNNITNGEAYDGQTAAACQAFVTDVVKAYLGTRASR
jgi:adenosylhomocysteine nucleosidase